MTTLDQNARNAQLGKTKPRPSYNERVKKKAAVSNLTLGLICFVVIGGGKSRIILADEKEESVQNAKKIPFLVVFELVRLFL